MIKFIGRTTNTSYVCEEFPIFLAWEAAQTEWQLDVETNVVDELPDRKLKVIQFGNAEIQWVIQWDYLSDAQKELLKNVLENKNKKKYIHYAMFEYTVLAMYGIIIDNVVCTLLQEKILTTGLDPEPGYHSLKEVAKRYLGIEMSKEEQTTFDVEFLNDAQIKYAADDVKTLQKINEIQLERIELDELMEIRNLENNVVCAFGDITVNGMLLDIKAWRDLYDYAFALLAEDKEILDNYLRTELKDESIALDILKEKDTIIINWSSPKQRKIIFTYLYPKLEGVTKPIIKKYADAHRCDPLWEYLEGNFDTLELMLIHEHQDFLVEGGFMLLAGSITINWNSTIQRLELFKTVEPHLTDTSKESLARTVHPIIKDYRNYIDTAKLVSSYGEAFIDKYVDSDGYVRTGFNQILNTGRVSSSKPNMQQIPSKESVGNKYRNCFIAPKDWVFVSSDYSSQELVVIATISNDPVWMEVIKAGQDLHSVCADLVFGNKWADGALDNCIYMKTKQKCKCPKHKTMRVTVKTINFGLAYGMSAHKLASTMQITRREAQALINKYFIVFPKIKNKLGQFGAFGMINGYIITPPPFKRRRWFSKGPTDKKEVIEHLKGKYNRELGIIERASKNLPIQGASADMTKLALVYVRNYINDNKLRDKVKLVMQVHDQIDTICHKSYAKVWQKKMTELMEAAAKVIIPSGLLKSETTISEKWNK